MAAACAHHLLEVFEACCMKLAATNHLWQIGVGVGCTSVMLVLAW